MHNISNTLYFYIKERNNWYSRSQGKGRKSWEGDDLSSIQFIVYLLFSNFILRRTTIDIHGSKGRVGGPRGGLMGGGEGCS